MSVHYKFKTAVDYSTVTFDGIHISVSELKKSIIDQKRLGKNADFDLQIINAQTKEVYSDENSLIPKNTSVMVARIPITEKKRSGPPPKDNVQGRGMHHKGFHQQSGAEVAKGSDLASMDLTEEEKIRTMMTQSTADYDPQHYVKIRGANQHGRVPDNYRCNRCGQGGHWINRCPIPPNIQADVKKSTGIPRSFMVVVDSPDVPGALMTPEGRYAVPAVDHATYSDKGKGQQPEQPAKHKIPDDLLCALCNDLLTDALLIPCCANSYCDDCIRNHLVESEHECPGCHEKDISPTTLIPNRFLRVTVQNFKNESGYSKPEKIPERPPPKTERQKAEEARKPSLDELPLDLFPHSPKKVGAEAEVEVADPESTKDIYDFNDESIPSPFASPKRNEAKVEPPPGGDHRAIRSLSRPFPSQPGMHRGPPGGPPPSHHSHHMQRKPYPDQGPRETSMEPPPPGFEVLPPGEDGSHNRPPQGPGPYGPGRDAGQRDGNGHLRGPPSIPPNGPPPFNPMQPPPGFAGGPGPHPSHGMMQGPPPGVGGPPGIPPPGYGPPPHGHNANMGPYPNSYNRLPPPHMGRGQMPPMHHHGGPPPHRHPIDHDDFGRGRGRRYGPPGRMDDPMMRGDENRMGTIDDPLKEFERIMREKDRRKKMAAAGGNAGPRKRSKSRSFSPSPRRVSPYPPKRSRSRSFSRSPSPKRKRPLPAPKRRRSYSRSPSRTPPPMRRGKSRSRSPRNRSITPTPTPPGKIRRSPRRAPPQYSPSPPPSRFSRKEKDEYFENRARDRDRDRDRYEERGSSRYPAKSSYASRDEGKYYSAPPKHEAQSSHKYDSQRQPLRPYHATHLGHGMPPHDQQHPPYSDKPPSLMDSGKGSYDYDSNLAPPGTEPIAAVPSLLDLKIQQPPHPTNLYPITARESGGHHEGPYRASEHEPEKSRRDEAQPVPAAVGAERKKSSTSVEDDNDKQDDKSKKHKKEKKKHKKKNKEEKREKKSKKAKEKSGGVDKSSEEEHETEQQNADNRESRASDSITEKKAAIVESDASKVHLDVAAAMDTTVGTVKQTAPCDSTVMSPDRGHEIGTSGGESITVEAQHGQPEPTAKTLTAESSNAEVDDVPEKKSPHEIARRGSKELQFPTSKWDEFDDCLLGNPKATTQLDNVLPTSHLQEGQEQTETRKVTPDVLKRAESAIYDKPSKNAPEVLVRPKDELKKVDASLTYRNEPTTIQSAIVQQQGKPDLKTQTSSVSSAVYRKSAKDRLGSKVSEDEAVLNFTKTIESSVSIKSKVSAVKENAGGEGLRKRRSRSRSPASYSTRNYRTRSPPRPEKDARSSPRRDRRRPSKERVPSRERRMSPSRDRPHSPSRDRRPSPSRDRRRSRSKDRRRSPDKRMESDRRRSGSRERRRSRDRRPSRERERPRRSRSPDKSRARRSSSREPFRGRDQPRPDSRERPRRSKSPEKRNIRDRSRDRDRYGSNYRRPGDAPRSRDDEGRKEGERDRSRGEGRREPPPLMPPRSTDKTSTKQESVAEPPSPEARVFQQAGSAGSNPTGQVFSPTLKKQKGRINIKLSSMSKTEQVQSGSSSSDDEHHATESKHSESGDEGKKRRKRRHSSTSTKSGSSSDAKKKKKKKDKKKKKKKKKSK